ncbi:caspase family protein [Pedobacter sp. JY14-1]|uniref:caspase family protein n=1 Tax=Pedobacter sp. JY14-1 TaxID=3034151 RepID=UPI0023E2517A|nr:caspase family protein [Pedobacter sp. JY14-1]
MRKALIVGINDYPTAPLAGCVNDAMAMKNVLERDGDGSPNFQVKLLVEPSTRVSKAILRKAITDLFRGEADVALLYFSGHGLLKSSTGYLITSDYIVHDEGISMDEILKLAISSKIKDKIIILDCCNSGSFGELGLGVDTNSVLGEGMTILTACHNDETSLESNGRGIFTTLIVDALQGGAADIRGNITPGSIYAYVDEALGAWDQRPVFKTNVGRFTPIRKIAPKVPLEMLRNLTTYFDTPEADHKLSPKYEDSEADHDPEKVKIFKELQKFVAVGLVLPVGEEHMYYAAMNSTSCKLTAMGYQYWRLVKEGKI